MLLFLILLFTVLPLVEFSILISLGQSIGLVWTILLVLGTGVLGAALARWQGVQTAWRIREQMATGKMPTDALFDGALILVAGAVLITPGVLTDAFGFSLLIPPLRQLIKAGLKRHFQGRFVTYTTLDGRPIDPNQPQVPPGSSQAQPETGDSEPKDKVIDARVIENR